ncbi:uracil DNA glycosylase [Pseudogymnoascus verrucosus]|uniref:Uracil DNA glycosylase n=1 Tax=Pseudogymnoascus verrucosus TaxID=342668 RepID=A0A1B8GE26_9PEZI|nr:uracil DNA glycosylase [Pseudogymnoascus verrucosus]OBT94085.1 uracil DNA glycosylase [Pseudogymnoascus verrucosus]
MEIFAPLRPGVDVEGIVRAEGDGEMWEWRKWLLDSAAALADDKFTYHVSQGKLGGDASRFVFERHARVGEFIPSPMIPIERVPIRANFKDTAIPPNQHSPVTLFFFPATPPSSSSSPRFLFPAPSTFAPASAISLLSSAIFPAPTSSSLMGCSPAKPLYPTSLATSAQSTIISEDLLSDDFRKYLAQPAHDPYRNTDATRVQIDIRIALSNTEIEIDAIGYVVPKDQIPNQTSFVLFGQRQCINSIRYMSVPRAILVAKGRDMSEEVWGEIVVYEYVNDLGDLISIGDMEKTGDGGDEGRTMWWEMAGMAGMGKVVYDEGSCSIPK